MAKLEVETADSLTKEFREQVESGEFADESPLMAAAWGEYVPKDVASSRRSAV